MTKMLGIQDAHNGPVMPENIAILGHADCHQAINVKPAPLLQLILDVDPH